LIDNLKRYFRLEYILILLYCLFQVILVIAFDSAARNYLVIFYVASMLFVILTDFLLAQSEQSLTALVKMIFPLPLIYLFYRISGIQTVLLGFPTHDAFFNHIEAGLLGTYPTFALQRIMEVWLNEIGYMLYGLGWALPLAAFYKIYGQGGANQLKSFVLAIEIGSLACLVIASAWPVAGPEKALTEYYYLGFYGPWFSLIVPRVIDLLGPQAASFPAIYFCVIAIAAYYLWDFGKSYIIISLFLMACVYWGGIYLRYHYLADGPVALLIAFFACIAAAIAYRTVPAGSDKQLVSD
jgi:hypothetical protein